MRTSLPRILGSWALLLPGVIAFQPTFGGSRGYFVALAGVTIGAALALLATRLRWGIAALAGSLLAGYLIVGGPLVLPHTTLGGVLPSLETLRSLALLIVQSWNDLLTVATPAGDFEGPAAVPLLAGMVAGAGMLRVVTLSRAVISPLAIPLGWLALSIAFGVRYAPAAVWLGAALGVGMLVWLTAHRFAATRTANTEILLNADRSLNRTAAKALAAAGVIVLAASSAVAINLVGADQVNRHVLRDAVTPPLNLHEFASPLMKYRLFLLDQKDEGLFRVEAMPEDARLRLAVLDTYDGNVFNVSQQSNEYLNVGRELPWTPEGAITQASIEVLAYDDVWLPTFGPSSSFRFEGVRRSEQARGLHFNRAANQALTTARIGEGTVVNVQAVPEIPDDAAAREALQGAGVGTAPLATVSRVPDVLVQLATDLTADSTSAYEQLEALTLWMREQGAYSDGSDGITRSGHTNERLSSMFTSTQPVGNAEQYATAMALMATQLGIPARVVMGFHPNPDDDAPGEVWEVTGVQAQVWVEANLDGAGWVAFDPTPDRDKEPQTDTPRPQPKPKPQVDPPPNPPEKLPEEPIVADDEAVNVDEEDQSDDAGIAAILLIIGAIAGGLLILALPFLVILMMKVRRAARRRTRGQVTDQIAGAWDEVVDRARDLGYVAPSSSTRGEAATSLQSAYPSAPVATMARSVDATIFGDVVPNEALRTDAWVQAEDLKSALLSTAPWYARPRAVFSANSLKRRRTEVAHTRRRPKTGAGKHAKESR